MASSSIKNKILQLNFPSFKGWRGRELFLALLIFICAYFVISSGCGELGTGLSGLSISPKNSIVGVRQAVAFTAIARDASGKLISVTPSWSVVGGIGTITSGGIFIAGSATGEGKVVVTANDLSAEASVLVTDSGWIQGTIFDQTGNTIPDIKVYLNGYANTLFAFSNNQGFYSISSVPAGTYQVWTTAVPGVYLAASSEANVSVSTGETVTVNLTVTSFTSPPNTVPPTVPF